MVHGHHAPHRPEIVDIVIAYLLNLLLAVARFPELGLPGLGLPHQHSTECPPNLSPMGVAMPRADRNIIQRRLDVKLPRCPQQAWDKQGGRLDPALAHALGRGSEESVRSPGVFSRDQAIQRMQSRKKSGFARQEQSPRAENSGHLVHQDAVVDCLQRASRWTHETKTGGD